MNKLEYEQPEQFEQHEQPEHLDPKDYERTGQELEQEPEYKHLLELGTELGLDL